VRSAALRRDASVAWLFCSARAAAAVNPARSAPLVDDLIEWMKPDRAKLSRNNDLAKAMDYMLKRLDAFTRFLQDGRICL
jgi:transposase